jgi:restriction system protein
MKAVLSVLASAGGEARLRDLFPAAENQLELSEYERATLEKSGYVRWQAIVHFYSIDLVKSGFIRKEAGRWILTDSGREALKLAPDELIRRASEGYSAWEAARAQEKTASDVELEAEGEKIERQTGYEQAVERARAEIERHINAMGPYDFQRFVAELLIAMDYHVPFVAPVGADGGIDIVAYKDPLGTTAPRIRVQVKHREQKVTVNEVRELEGLLKKEGDIGLIVSSSGLTAEAVREVRSSHRHIETMDLDRLIRLWQDNYDRLRESGKKLVPLVRVFFLAPTEEN